MDGGGLCWKIPSIRVASCLTAVCDGEVDSRNKGSGTTYTRMNLVCCINLVKKVSSSGRGG